MNQLGYVPEAGIKSAYLYHWAGDRGPIDYSAYEGRPFHLVNQSDGSIAFSGEVAFRADQAVENQRASVNPGGLYGSPVWECDFSEFQIAGDTEYRVVVPGLGCSFPFVVDPDVYRSAFVTTLRGLYHHRSGPARGLPYSTMEKPEDHIPGQDRYHSL